MITKTLYFIFSLPARVMMGLIAGYRRLISPVLSAAFGQRCRFYPSCSEYALEAVRVHGAVRGGGLAIWRLARCQPFARSGLDPVPARPAPVHSHAPLPPPGPTYAP